MHGFSLALPSTFGGKANLPRSLSSPTLPDFSKSRLELNSSSCQPNELPRSASYTSLPTFDYNFEFGEEFLPAVFTQLLGNTNEQEQEKQDDQKQDEQKQHDQKQNDQMQDDQQQTKSNEDETCKDEVRSYQEKQQFATEPMCTQDAKSHTPERHTAEEKVHIKTDDSNLAISNPRNGRESTARAVSGSFAAIVRKPWATSSKTLQRKGKGDKDLGKIALIGDTLNNQPVNSKAAIMKSSSKSFLDPVPKLSKITIQKILERPSSMFVNNATFNSTNSSISSLHASSYDSHSTPRTSTDRAPPLPTKASVENFEYVTEEGFGKRDELSSAFRVLDHEYSKFQSKSWSLKTNVVRSSLILFLRNHVTDVSFKSLRPEDLERRINVLNKWWAGLLEMLSGRHNQMISGVDRPVILQGCYEIMIRPEWRQCLPAPRLRERLPVRSSSRRLLLSKRCSSSFTSTIALPYMVDSINQRIRSLFVHNLMLQINFVVDKMSLRNAPASLVAFCGKAAAYAFIFVPGVAEILVRIWKLQPDILRRVSNELDLPRKSSKLEFDSIMSYFPAHLQCLGWSSVKSMYEFLRVAPCMPILAEKTAWYGPWVPRWCGRDSDLFFIFAKYYHILIEDFFTPNHLLQEKVRAPGYLLVLAQTLTAMDCTIHRQPALDSLPITFDDMLAGGIDASAAAIPLPSSNSARFMAENRLIMLLRDFLCENPSESERAQMTFSQTHGRIIQAASRKISLYNHSACFTLCDFLEEALTIFARFHEDKNIINWHFWLDVCKKMLQSENTMTEIRLIAFLYGIWNVVIGDEQRKKIVCLDWLLTEEVFDKYFNHWCPMVRAYYMRLVCWRICRNDGDSSNLDIKIFNVVLIRIKNFWAHYLCLKEQANANNTLPPSTSPCLPAPGRRLLIIRIDNPSPVKPLVFGLDGLMSRNGHRCVNHSTSFARNSPPSQLSRTNPILDSAADSEKNNVKLTPEPLISPLRKRWSFIGRVTWLPFLDLSPTARSNESCNPSITGSTTTSKSSSCSTEDSKNITPPKLQDSTDTCDNGNGAGPPMIHRVFSFRFSLEFGAFFENGTGGGLNSNNSIANGPQQNGNNGIPVPSTAIGERRLTPPRLPAPAQALLAARVPSLNQEIISRDWTKTHNRNSSLCEKESPSTTRESRQEKSTFPLEAASVKAKNDSYFSKISDSIVASEQKIFTTTSIYRGRALAEWAVIVGEYNGFLERRRNEGVPNLKMVEVPMLGVEGFRRYG